MKKYGSKLIEDHLRNLIIVNLTKNRLLQQVQKMELLN